MSAHGMFLASLSQSFFYAKMPTFMLVSLFQKYFSDTLPFLQPEWNIADCNIDWCAAGDLSVKVCWY